MESQIAFLRCWRTEAVNTGHFMRVFDEMLDEYMKGAARAYGTRYSGACSLDAARTLRTGEGSCNGYTFLEAPPGDESRLYVNMFLGTLPRSESHMVRDLLAGYTRAEIARKYRISPYRLARTLDAIGRRYQVEYA